MATEFVRNNLSCGFEYYIIEHVQSKYCNGEALKMPGWETIKMDTGEILNGLLENLSNLTYIKAEDIPNIDLYMDQVTTFMDKRLRATTRNPGDDKVLTKTMINNYAKNNLLPPPVKKKYSHDHMITLMFIYYFKTLMSISDIQSILGPLTDRFFGDKGSVSLEHIYKEIYQGERERLSPITKDIISMFKKAENSFSDVTDEQERDYLRTFSFICYLCFDMYLKKEMVENIIDEFNSKNDTENPDSCSRKK